MQLYFYIFITKTNGTTEYYKHQINSLIENLANKELEIENLRSIPTGKKWINKKDNSKYEITITKIDWIKDEYEAVITEIFLKNIELN